MNALNCWSRIGLNLTQTDLIWTCCDKRIFPAATDIIFSKPAGLCGSIKR